MRPRFSIIVPMYNVEKYISQCIDSVLEQSFSDYELLLIDDDSEDHSLQIAQKYAERDSRILACHKEHGGLPSTRNVGLRMAKGEYIALLDGDDFWHKEHLERVNSVLLEYSPDMCISNNYVRFFSSGSTEVSLFPFSYDLNHGSLEAALTVISDLNNCFPASATLTVYSTRFLEENHFFYDEKCACSEDMDFFLQALSRVNVIKFTNHVFYYYRQDNVSAMTKNMTSKMYLSRLGIVKKWFDYYQGKEIGNYDCNQICVILEREFKSHIIAALKAPANSQEKKEVTTFLRNSQYIWGVLPLRLYKGNIFLFRVSKSRCFVFIIGKLRKIRRIIK